MATQVLLADDHQIVRQGIRAMLEHEGFRVVGEAADGREAVRMAETTRPDVAILDLAMPRLNGLDSALLGADQDHPPDHAYRGPLRAGGAARRRQRLRAEDPGHHRPGPGNPRG